MFSIELKKKQNCIGIDQMTAYKKYNIKPITTQIEDQYKTITERIIESINVCLQQTCCLNKMDTQTNTQIQERQKPQQSNTK